VNFFASQPAISVFQNLTQQAAGYWPRFRNKESKEFWLGRKLPSNYTSMLWADSTQLHNSTWQRL